MKKIYYYILSLLTIIMLVSIGIAQGSNLPTIPNGFIINLPTMPQTQANLLLGNCQYESNANLRNIKIWNHYSTNIGSARIEYSFEIAYPRCIQGFKGNFSYSTLTNPTSNLVLGNIANNLGTKILNSITTTPLPQTPISSGNSQ